MSKFLLAAIIIGTLLDGLWGASYVLLARLAWPE